MAKSNHSNKRIQIVDKNGKFLGLATDPKEARRKSQIRLISRVNLVNGKGQYLLQKRAEHMDAWPGCWDHSGAGHVDAGETPEEAAYRELAEEIGVTNVVLTHQRELYHDNSPEADGSVNRMYSHIYTGLFNGNIKSLRLDPDEVSEVRWFSVAEINHMINENPASVTDGILVSFGENT